MSTNMYKNSRKEDLVILLNELGEPADSDSETVVQLRTKIEASQIFKDDPGMVTGLLSSIVEDRKAKSQIEAQKLELEKIKLAQLEKQLEIENAKKNNHSLEFPPDSQSGNSIRIRELENLIKSVRTLTIPVPEKSENLNLFFQTLERAFTLKNVPEDLKSEILINILAEKLNNILCFISDEDIKCYKKVKLLVLKEYQPTAQECLIRFKKAIREKNETHIQFASRLNALFRYYLELRDVNNFELLCDLIIHDKLFESLDRELSTHISIREGEHWLTPKEIAKECDIFFVNKGKSFTEIQSLNLHARREFPENKTYSRSPKGIAQPHSRGAFQKTNKEKQISCYICGQNHFAKSCPKRNFKPEVRENRSQEVTLNSIQEVGNGSLPNEPFICDLQYCEILLDNKHVKALIDSGSSILVLNKNIVSEPKEIISQINLMSCFKENKSANLSKFMISLINRVPIEITGAICEDLSCDAILPINIFYLLQKQKKENEMCLSPVNKNDHLFTEESKSDSSFLLNESNFELNCFLLNISNVVETNDLDLSHISDYMLRDKLSELINNYKPNKTETTNLKMKIILNDDIPVCQRSRRLSFAEKQEVERQVDQWLAEGIIRESCSDYCSPVVVCRKRNGNLRLCIDYRKLNKKTIKDKYPLPIIEEIFDKLGKGNVFTTLDLKNAFFHVDVDEDSRKYTAFATDTGQYEYMKMGFGLCNSPSMFQRYVNKVFQKLLKDGTLVIYLDDIIIPANDEQEGIEKLTRVLETASKFGLELNLKKCQFMKQKINFLCHIIENGTIKPSVEKTIAVQKFPEPRNVKEIQSFLGLTGYFRKFIPHYAIMARPLSDLLRGSKPFKFEGEEKMAFQRLKNILCDEPVLHLFKPGRKLELHTDASKLGFGAILLQEGEDGKFHPIHYMSKKTSEQEEKYGSYELEVLAVIEALKKFRNYLLGNKFKIYTDCSAFTKTLDKKELTPKVARWTLFLQEFDYEIEHRPGNRMRHVDALSRHPVMVVIADGITHRIVVAQETDEYIRSLKNLLQQGEINDFVLKNNVLYKIINDEELLVVPEDMQSEIIKEVHDKGHFAMSKTEEILKRDYFIPGVKKKIENTIRNCVKCLLCNKKSGKKEGFLNPIQKDLPLSTYHADFIGPLPSTNKNYQHIFTVVDAFTKFTWLYPVRTVSAEEALSKLRLQQKTFGNPSRIITDRGSAFTSNTFEQYCSEEGVQHSLIATGVPRGNGQVERIHRTIIPVLSKLTFEDPTKWYKHVDRLQRILNSTVNRSTKWTPFQLLTGVPMKNKEDLIIRDVLDEENKRWFLENREEIREEARQQILKIQEENKRQHDKKCKEAHKYKIGDWVAIQRTQFGTGLKLRPKFFGPYRITRVKPNDRYEVEKVGSCDGPNTTSTAADLMKEWVKSL